MLCSLQCNLFWHPLVVLCFFDFYNFLCYFNKYEMKIITVGMFFGQRDLCFEDFYMLANCCDPLLTELWHYQDGV